MASTYEILDPQGRPIRSRQRPQPGLKLSRNILEHLHQVAGVLTRNDRVTLKTYETMVDTDETIQAGLEFVALSTVAQLGDFEHPDKKIQGFVRSNFEDMRSSLSLKCGEILSSLWAGFSTTEMILRAEGSQIRLHALDTLNPRTVALTVNTDPGNLDYGALETVWQWKWSGWESKIPASKCLHYAHRARFGDPYGRSRLRAAYKTWFLKDAMLAAWGTTLDRYGAPFTTITTKDLDAPQDFPDGRTGSRGEYLLALIDDLRANSGLVLEEGEQVVIDRPGTRIGEDFEGVLEYCDRRMLRALMIPPLMLEGEKGGSYALGGKQFALMVLFLDYVRRELVEVLTEQLCRPLIGWNYGPQETYGTFALPQTQAEDMKTLAEGFRSLMESGWISPLIQADLDLVRERVGFPKLTEAQAAVLFPVASSEEDPEAPPKSEDPKEDPTAEDPDEKKASRVINLAERRREIQNDLFRLAEEHRIYRERRAG